MSGNDGGAQGGFTMVELMVTVALVLVVLGISLDFLVNVTNVDARAMSVETATRDTRFALRTMSQEIRSAASLATSLPTSGSCPSAPTYATCLQFTVVRSDSSMTPNCPYRVITYGLRSGVIAEDRTDYKLSGSSCVLASRTNGRRLLGHVPSTVTSLFTYFDHSGAQIAPANVVGGAPPTVNVASVLISVTSAPTRGAPVSLSSFAALRNSR
jgi:prepilin-type N-terminal cleavage/methylation domain-containing protein